MEDKNLFFSKVLRDSIHNLDLSSNENMKIFSENLKDFLKIHEGVRFEAYDDKTPDKKTGGGKPIREILASGGKVVGDRTIGVGFNMDTGSARKEWESLFHVSVSFDDAYNGKLKLTEEQVDRLLYKSLSTRCQQVEEIYENIWSKLRANERITILSLYFNGPKLVSKGTKFYAHIKAYVETGHEKHLQEAVYEVRHRSNRDKEDGTQDRRNCEAELLDSTKAPFYSKPNEPLYPQNLLHIKLNDVIVPRGFNKIFPVSSNTEYFIWRTRLDGKVRAAHLAKEGRIFKRTSMDACELPGQSKGCRCWEEPLTQNIVVIDEKSLSYFIRYGKPGVYYEIEGLW